MAEKPKGFGHADAQGLTNKAFGLAWRGVKALSKAGYNAAKEGYDNKAATKDREAIFDVMYNGKKHLPGQPPPPLVTSVSDPKDQKKFIDAANRLIDRGVPLPGNVTSFASTFNLVLKKPKPKP